MTTPEVFSAAWMAQLAATLERISSPSWRLHQGNRSTAKEAAAMTTQARPQTRVRIEVSTSVKGVHSYSATVETLQPDNFWGDPGIDVVQATLTESDRLVAELDKRYPKEV